MEAEETLKEAMIINPPRQKPGYLQASAVVGELPDPVQNQVYNLLSHSVVASSIVKTNSLYAVIFAPRLALSQSGTRHL